MKIGLDEQGNEAGPSYRAKTLEKGGYQPSTEREALFTTKKLSTKVPITPKQAGNINTDFGCIAENLAKERASVIRRFKLIPSLPSSLGYTFALGVTFHKTTELGASWAYEAYVGLAFWTLRIGFRPYRP